MNGRENGKLIVRLHIDEEQNETDICMWYDVLSVVWITFFFRFPLLVIAVLPLLWRFCRFRTAHDRNEDDRADA